MNENSHQHRVSTSDSPVQHVGHSSVCIVTGATNYNGTLSPDSVYMADRQPHIPSHYTRLGTFSNTMMYNNQPFHQPLSIQPSTVGGTNGTVSSTVGSTIPAAASTVNSTVGPTNGTADSTLATTGNVCSTNTFTGTVAATSDGSTAPIPDQCVHGMESGYGASTASTDSRVSVSVRLPSLSNHSHGNHSQIHSSHDSENGSHDQYNDPLLEDINFDPLIDSEFDILSLLPDHHGNESSPLPTASHIPPHTVLPDHGLQLVPTQPTQSSGRGFSLSVEISGDGGGNNTIGLNLDVSGIQVCLCT